MADFLTKLRDAMNLHAAIKIKVPGTMDADRIEGRVKAMMKRWGVVTWGWQKTANTIAFRVYQSDRYTARGRLAEAGYKPEKEKEPNGPLVPPSSK